jgi:hypothetical protein
MPDTATPTLTTTQPPFRRLVVFVPFPTDAPRDPSPASAPAP